MKILYSHKALGSLIAIVGSFFIFSCASAVPENKWQYDAVNMAQAYQKHFLEGKINRATLDLRHAKHFAKQSSNLKTLIDIELTQCAMQLAILKSQDCKHIQELLKLQPNTAQEAYLDFISSTLKVEDINLLPKQYHDFAEALKDKNMQDINNELQSMQTLSSRLIASALAIKYINDKNISILIQELSFSGYKQALISWLSVQASKEKNKTKKDSIEEKIKILISKDV